MEVLLRLENIEEEDDEEEEDDMKLEEENEEEKTKYSLGILKLDHVLSNELTQKFYFLKNFQSNLIDHNTKFCSSIENNIKIILLPSSSSLLLLEKFNENFIKIISKISPEKSIYPFQVIGDHLFPDQNNQILCLTNNGIICISLPQLERRKECLSFSKSVKNHFQKQNHLMIINAYDQFVKGKSIDKIDLPNLNLKSILEISSFLTNQLDPSCSSSLPSSSSSSSLLFYLFFF